MHRARARKSKKEGNKRDETLQKKELTLILDEAKSKGIIADQGMVHKKDLQSVLQEKSLNTINIENLEQQLNKFHLSLPNPKSALFYKIDLKKLTKCPAKPTTFMDIVFMGTQRFSLTNAETLYEEEKECFLCISSFQSRDAIVLHLINQHIDKKTVEEGSKASLKLNYEIPKTYLNVKVEIENISCEDINVASIHVLSISGKSEKFNVSQNLAANNKMEIFMSRKYFKECNKSLFLMIFFESNEIKYVEFHKLIVNNTLAALIHQARNRIEDKYVHNRDRLQELKSYLYDKDLIEIFSKNFDLKPVEQVFDEKKKNLYKLILEFKKCDLKLNPLNYVTILKLLVEIDDLYANHAIMKIIIQKALIKSKKGHNFFEIPKSCTHSEVLEEGDIVVMQPVFDYKVLDIEVIGIISKIADNGVYFDCEDPLFAKTTRTYKVTFRKDRLTTQMEQKSLSEIGCRHIESILFPSESIQGHKSSFDFKWFNSSIGTNPEQQQAVMNIVNGTSQPAPYIIFGPPGTGKTSTIVETIAQVWKLKPESKILVTAPTNTACDEIASRLLDYVSPMDLYRYYSKSGRRRMAEVDEDLKCISSFSRGTFSYPSLGLLKNYRIILSTVTNSGKLALMACEKDYFDYIFLDECGSSTEPSSIIPISGLVSADSYGKTKIIIAGDPKQLGPVIKCDFANHMGLGVSLLERLMNTDFYKPAAGKYNEKVITKLLQNFRSHPGILKTPNELFYAGELIPKASQEVTDFALNWKHLPNKNFPMIFHAVDGKSQSQPKSTSLYNADEIKQVFFYVREIVKHGFNSQKIPLNEIGIVSPYQLQVQKIKSQVKQFGWSGIEVGSAEQFQGKEKKVIILSTVRSNTKTAGFLGNEKRLNVVITRAKGLLIIIGNQKTLQLNLNWYKMLQYCKENNAIAGGNLELCEPQAMNVDSKGKKTESYESKFIKSLDKIQKEFSNKFHI